jgi:hypothetical protein
VREYHVFEGTRAEIVAQLERWRDHWAHGHRDLAETCQRALDAVQAGSNDEFAVGTRYLVVED